MPVESDPLKFWEQNNQYFPALADAAKRFFTAASTSVASLKFVFNC
jgi:hypothetical protein